MAEILHVQYVYIHLIRLIKNKTEHLLNIFSYHLVKDLCSKRPAFFVK